MAKLSEVLGQNIIIENRPGTSAMVGTDAVAKAAPDGYTLLFGVTQHAINPTLQPKLPYDTLNDFIPIARVTSQPLYMGVHVSVPGNSVSDVVAHIKANPNKYNYASTGVGTSIHLAGAYFASQAGLGFRMCRTPTPRNASSILAAARYRCCSTPTPRCCRRCKAAASKFSGAPALHALPGRPTFPRWRKQVFGAS